MGENSSIALPESQAVLHCPSQAQLYNIEMTLGKRIRAARERLRPKPTQEEIGKYFGVSDKAVSAWERDDTIPELDKVAKLARILRVPCIWLLEGGSPPPPIDSFEVQFEQLSEADQAVVSAMLAALQKQRA
jgi:transcriptional regulator with XRE-family HTH domain